MKLSDKCVQYAHKSTEIESRYFLNDFRMQPSNQVFSFEQPDIIEKL